MGSSLSRNPNIPRRGQGVKSVSAPLPVSDVEMTQDSEEIYICTDVEVPEELKELASELAIGENLDNIPTFAIGAEINPKKMALITGKKWQNGRVLRIAFMDGEKVVQDKVIAIAREWEQYANIKFQVVEDKNNSEIRIDFNPKSGSWSYLGTDNLSISKDKPTMNLGWLTPNTSDAEYSRVVLHEFGHALGCIHEHQHPEVGIPWNKEKVYNYYMGPPNNWPKSQVDTNIFGKYSINITQFSDWDRDSIMSYAVPKSLTDGNFTISWNTKLSDTDKKFIAEMYPFPPSPAKNDEYIERLFMVILGRKPSKVEQGRYADVLKTKDRNAVVQAIEKETENVDQFTNDLYQLALKRKPTDKELENVRGQVKSFVSEENIISQVFGGDEFFVSSSNNVGVFIGKLFTSLLSRTPTNEEVRHYTLNVTLYGRTHVTSRLLASREYRNKIVKEFYNSILSRNPTFSELNSLVNSSIELANIRYTLESSQEFYNK